MHTKYLTPEEAQTQWDKRFKGVYKSLPKGRVNNAQEKKELIRKLATFSYRGKVFSNRFIAKSINLSRSVVRYHRKNLGV